MQLYVIKIYIYVYIYIYKIYIERVHTPQNDFGKVYATENKYI